MVRRLAHAHHHRARCNRDDPLVSWNPVARLDMSFRCRIAAQFTSIRYGERLAEIGSVPSIGSIGDCLFDRLIGSRSKLR